MGPVAAGDDHPVAAGSAVQESPTEVRALMPAGSTWTVPPSCAWAMVSAAARIGDVPGEEGRSMPGGALRASFGRSEMARNLTTMPSAVTAIANP
jgi:hypothetical protein